MFDRFTDRARKIMGHARQASQRFSHDYIGTEHMLLGLCEVDNGVGGDILRSLDIASSDLVLAVEREMQFGTEMITEGQLPFTPRGKRTLELALEESSQFGHNYIGSEHLLLALLRADDGIATKALWTLGARYEAAREACIELLGSEDGRSCTPIETLRDWFRLRSGRHVVISLTGSGNGGVEGKVVRVARDFVELDLGTLDTPPLHVTWQGIATFRDA